MTPEFNLIKRFFTRPVHDVDLGIGDDAALLRVKDGHQLVISTDMSVAGTHFFEHTDAFLVGWKSMAVNVSDMAAMGAHAQWATLALALPTMDAAWLEGFSRGLFACADQFGVQLIGGDTTRGPLTISVTIFGEVPHGQALRRDGAKAGDDIWVSGELGSAALALQALLGHTSLPAEVLTPLKTRLDAPQPRAELGVALRGIAHSAIDLSDGLIADLSHMLQASNLVATLAWEAIPRSPLLEQHASATQVQACVLSGGDDYELCFTAPVSQRSCLEGLAHELGLKLSRIGFTADPAPNQPQVRVLDAQQRPIDIQRAGYDHFA